MDDGKHQIPQTLSQFRKPLFLKKITLLLLSVSVFSFFFSYSSWLYFSLHSFNFYFSAFPFQVLKSYTIDRTCIFLLCNGILVFLVRNSGNLTNSSPSGSDHDDEFFKNNGDDLSLGSASLLDKEVAIETSGSLEKAVVEEGREEEEKPKLVLEDEEQETESDLLLTEEREEDEEESVAENEKEEEETESGLLTEEEDEGDELNKKFDDFIRRMKEEIRIEAQQQLVLVKG